MKKLSLILLLPALLCVSCSKDKKATYLVSTITEHCDDFDSIESFEYDDKNRITQDRTDLIFFEGGVETDRTHNFTTYEYFDNDSLKKESYYIFENQTDVLQDYSEYSLENNLVSLRLNYQRNNSGELMLRNKCEYEYDSFNRLIRETIYNTKLTTPDDEIDLFKAYVNEYTYVDDSDLMLTIIYSDYEEDETLLQVSKTVCIYENSKLIKEDEYYGETIDSLRYDEQVIYNYFLNNLTSVVTYELRDDTLVIEHQEDYTYDSKNRNTKIVETQYYDEEVYCITTTTFEFDNNDCVSKKTKVNEYFPSGEIYIQEELIYTYIKAN